MKHCQLEKSLDPTVQSIDNVLIRKYYSFLRSTILRPETVSLMKLLINEQTLFTIMGRMLAVNWKPWAVSRLVQIKGVETAFERFAEQNARTH